MKKRKAPPRTLFELAGMSKKDFEVIALVLGVIVATSSDADTRLKCHHALKSLRNLKRIVIKPFRLRGKKR